MMRMEFSETGEEDPLLDPVLMLLVVLCVTLEEVLLEMLLCRECPPNPFSGGAGRIPGDELYLLEERSFWIWCSVEQGDPQRTSSS
jgi:hypothetical protein